MKRFIKQRYPFVERGLMLPKIYHWGFFICCLSAVNFSVVLDLWQSYWQRQAITLEVIKQSTELTHQEKLLATLKQHSERHELSPQLTKRIIALDEQIHDLLNDEVELVTYQWDFSSRPVLQIQLEGYFQYLHNFLTALLTQQKALFFAQLDMQKVEGGRVQCHLILPLNIEE
ncbi:hypothetical protein [Rodentibacter caecimuris]|nr:hypothetical protein [Rodentibacter heylii]